MKNILLLLILISPLVVLSQKTKVQGVVIDGISGEVMPFVTVRFLDTKIGTLTDSLGYYEIETYYASDSLMFTFSGYMKVVRPVVRDEAQVINVTLPVQESEFEEVIVTAPDEYPSTILHKKVIANKPINDKEKLESKTKHISDQEKKASEAERESIKFFQTLYISNYVGHVFEGVVSGIIEKGIFVELMDTKVEGLVTFDSMGEIFNVTAGRLRAKSRLSGMEFSIGQPVKVKINK